MIFLDTNVVSEVMRIRPESKVLAWLKTHDPELAISSIVIAEIDFGIQRVRLDERSPRLQRNLDALRGRYRGSIFSFDEVAAMNYGRIMGEAMRAGRPLSIPDGMIAAIALQHTAALATRNIRHFQHCGVELVDPWA